MIEINYPADIKFEGDISKYIGKSYSARFEFKPIKEKLGEITIGMVNTDTEFLTDERLTIRYSDGTKWTINKSWFE